jgi:hypothetical protein
MRFGSLSFIYTGPAESVAGHTFTWTPRPNVLTGAARREAFVRGLLDEMIINMLGPNPTQKRFRLAAYYLTDLAFQASGAELLAWGEFMERYTVIYPHGQPGLPDDPVTAYVNNLRVTGTATDLRRLGGHGPRGSTTPRGSAMSAWPQHRAALNRSQHRATALPMSNDGRISTSSRRLSASSTRSWPFFIKSWGWTQSLATDGLHKTSLCRSSPSRGTTSDASAAQLPSSHGPAPRCCRHGDEHATMLTVKFRQPSHEFTFSVCISFISYPLVLTPLV